ncbi:MAG TPA: hypothetical protein VGJ15_11605, partial [Pirellulales bacterium]
VKQGIGSQPDYGTPPVSSVAVATSTVTARPSASVASAPSLAVSVASCHALPPVAVAVGCVVGKLGCRGRIR